MILRIFLFGIVCASVCVACNRHTRITPPDPFNEIVEGDTVSFYPTMIPTLWQDSVKKNDAYYYRINKVKRVEIIDGNSRELVEIDRFGHELSEFHYIDGEIFWRNIDVYNRYGNIASGHHTFYDDATTIGNVYITKYKYEPDGWTLGQRIVRIDMERNGNDGDKDLEYAYSYTYNGRFIDVETRFKNGKCTEKVYYTYNEFGKPKEELTVEFENGGPDTTFRYYKYDSLQREVSWSEMHGGVLIEDHITEYNIDGRMSKYSSITYEPYSSYVFEYFYLKNGLLSHRIVTHADKSETERYSYSFY